MEGYIGTLMAVGFNFAPRSWAFCNGQALSSSQYTALFSLLGTTYGGNGQTTFALPDLRGRSIVHPGQGPGLSNIDLGQVGGSENITLTQNQMPGHTHTAALNTVAAVGTKANPQGHLLAGIQNGYEVSGTSNVQMAPQAITVAVAGGSQPCPSRNPFLGINVCICLQGVFPSRN